MSKPQAFLANRLYVPTQYVEPHHRAAFEYVWDSDGEDGSVVSDGLIRTYKTMEDERYVGFHRGDILKIEQIFGNDFEIVDKRSAPPLGLDLKMIDGFKFRENQDKALEAMCNPNLGGILRAQPAFGKTICVCCYIVAQGLTSLFLVDQSNLAGQFYDEMIKFTNILELEKELGRKLIGPVDKDRDEPYPISFSTYHYYASHGDCLKRDQNKFGVVGADEMHTTAAKIFSRVFTYFNPLIRMGVSATPSRKDGLHVLFDDLVGPIRYVAPRNSNTKCYVVNTGVQVSTRLSHFTNIVKTLAKNEKRNNIIARETKQAVLRGHKCIILVGLKGHAYELAELMKTKWDIRAIGITGSDKSYKQKEVKTKITEGDLDCVVATNKLFGKGFNLPALSHLGIALPTANLENFEQWVGRVEREVEGKLDPEVYYYADGGHGLLHGCKNVVKKACRNLNMPCEDRASYHQDNNDADVIDTLGQYQKGQV